MFNRINIYSKLLVITGLFFSLIIHRYTGSEWFDLIGFGLTGIGILLAKKDIINENVRFGIYIYYCLLIAFLIVVFFKWFS